MKYPFEIGKNLKEPTKIETIKKEFRNATVKNFDYFITKLLQKGGWKFVEEDDWGATWKKDFVSSYRITVYAVIGYKETHLDECWQYGIKWLEGDYKYQGHPLSVSDIKDVTEGLKLGLADLLARGIPYHPYSDITMYKDFYGLSYYDQKRNIDLLNATRLLEINYKAVLKHVFEGNKEELIKFVHKKEDSLCWKLNGWLREELENEEEE